MKRLGLGLVIGAMCALGGVSTANAATYCVNTASCVGGTVKPTLASALTAANAANDGDTVYVGAGTYTGDITLEQGTQLSGPQTGTATVAGTVQSNGGGLDHLTVDATGTGVRNGDGPSSLYQVIVKANVGLDVPKGALSAYDFVFLARGASPIGVRVGAPTSDGNPDTPAAGVMHGTLIAPAGSGTGASVYAATGDIAALSLNDVAFSGWATQVKRTGTPGAGGVDWKANLTTNYVALDPAKVSSSGPGDVTRQHELAAADTELDAAGVPLAGSPVVDAGDPSWTTNEPDIYGTRDPLDGDGNGSAIDDIGAAEYQAPGAPDPTQAKTYCVAYPSCPAGGIAEPTLDAAGAAVNADSGADTVLVGPGTFSTSILSLRAGTTLKGSGRDATTIAGALSTSHTTVSDLTVKVPAAATYGVSDSASTYFRVRIDGSAVTSDTAIGFLGDIGRSHLDQVTVTMAHGTGVTSDVVLTDVTIDAPIGIRALDYSVELHRVVIHANTGILLTARNVIGDNVVIFGTGANPVGISAHANDPSGAQVTLNHATFSSQSGIGTAIDAQSLSSGPQAEITLTNSVFCGWATQIRRAGTGSNPANVTADYVALDPAKITQSGPGTLTSTHQVSSADTKLDGVTGVPLAGSVAIDAADPSEAASTDVYGVARPIDGNGDGTAVGDLGAAEYRPAAPQTTPTPTATASPTVTSTPVATPSPTPTPTATAQVKRHPVALLLHRKRIGRQLFRVRARVVLDANGHGSDCAGAQAVFSDPSGVVTRSTFDAQCHADITVRVGRGAARRPVKLRVRFGGSDTLTAMKSSQLKF